jgi:hypothetical protein
VSKDSSFERNIVCKEEFSRWRKAPLVPRDRYNGNEDTQISLERKSSVLAKEASSKSFPSENSDGSLKEHFLHIPVFWEEKDSNCYSNACFDNRKKPMCPSEENHLC